MSDSSPCLEEVYLEHKEVKEVTRIEEVVVVENVVEKKALGYICCCVKVWSTCLNMIECICTGLSNTCLLCSSCFLGCNKCLEQMDCDGK